MIYYGATSLVHITALSYLSFFFRYRRLGRLPVLAIGSAYYCAFENINNIMYKVIVDRHVLRTARNFGLGEHCQPTGTNKPRDITFR